MELSRVLAKVLPWDTATAPTRTGSLLRSLPGSELPPWGPAGWGLRGTRDLLWGLGACGGGEEPGTCGGRGGTGDLPGMATLCKEVAHLAAPPSASLQPLHVIDFVDFNLERLPEAPLGAAQGAVHPARAGAVGGLPRGGGRVEGQRWDEPPPLRT